MDLFEQDGLFNRRRWQAIRLSRRIRHRLRIGWRRPLAPWRALPDFLIIGAQKCGTSSLYVHLTSHPQVLGAAWKEVHFFDNNFSKGGLWYRAHFPLARQLKRKHALTGEASPFYLYHPRAAERIAAVTPSAKLIALLRNPVDRAISHYWHQVKRGRESRSLEEALAIEKERLAADGNDANGAGSRVGYNHFHFSYLSRGLYADQLKAYGQHFDEGQLLVLKSEDLYQHVQDTFDRVTRFLGLPSQTLHDTDPRNTGTYPETRAATRRKLEAFFRPHNHALYDYVGAHQAWW